MADAAAFASPPSPSPSSPAVQRPSDSSPPPTSSPPPDTPASAATPAAQTPSLRRSRHPLLRRHARRRTLRRTTRRYARRRTLRRTTRRSPRPRRGEDDGINAPGAARKHMTLAPPAPPSKKSKKKGGNSVWTRPASRKGKKKAKQPVGHTPDAWFFEVKVVHLGASGHTRLGWATNRADLQTPVGYEAYGFGYRDIDGAKVHKAWRDKYADEGYGEGDVIGFYISLPDGERYEPKQPHLIQYKGMPFHVQIPKEEQKTQDPVPGSEICYFKNGVCQGIAFKDIPGGRYYPAASMYTLPNEPNCVVKFNFGPDFEFFPQDFGGMPIPQPMSEVPHQEYEPKNEKPAENGVVEKTS